MQKMNSLKFIIFLSSMMGIGITFLTPIKVMAMEETQENASSGSSSRVKVLKQKTSHQTGKTDSHTANSSSKKDEEKKEPKKSCGSKGKEHSKLIEQPPATTAAPPSTIQNEVIECDATETQSWNQLLKDEERWKSDCAIFQATEALHKEPYKSLKSEMLKYEKERLAQLRAKLEGNK